MINKSTSVIDMKLNIYWYSVQSKHHIYILVYRRVR